MSGRDARAIALGVPVLRAGLATSAGCGRRHAPVTPEAPGTPAPTAAIVAPPDADPGDAMPWQALVRDEQWDAAWHALEAMPEAMRSPPELRYVRARVALSRGDGTAAIPLLAGLEASLPLLAQDIGRRRAEAELGAGPVLDAAEYFAARPSPPSQLDAARGFEKGHDARRARAAA